LPGCSESFSFSRGLGSGAPMCGAALPSAGADPRCGVDLEEPPIRAVIQVRLAMLSGADSRPVSVVNPAR
jgi:hypothetical protein